MTAPVSQAPAPAARPSAPRPLSPGRHDGEEAGRFRDALARKAGHNARRAHEDPDAPPVPSPEAAGLLPVTPHPQRNNREMPGSRDDGPAIAPEPARGPQGAAGAQGPGLAEPPSVAASQAGGAGSLAACLDAGMPASTLSQLTLPGDCWRAGHVVIQQQERSLSVSVDLGRGREGESGGETLAELQRRLKARGIGAVVSRQG